VKEMKDIELGGFSAAIHISDPKAAHWLGVVIGMFRPKNGQLAVKGVLVREIDDRPSTYFFAEIRKGREDLSLLTKKKKTPLLGLKESLQEKNSTFDTKTIVTATAPYDVCVYLGEEEFGVCLFELKHEVVNRQPLGAFIRRKLRKIESVFDWDTSSARIANYCIENASCPVAILVDKVGIPSALEQLLFVYTGKPYEDYALHIFQNILINEPEVRVTVITDMADFAEKNHVQSETVRIQFFQSEEGTEITKTPSFEHGKNDFDLILVGSDRTNKDIYQTELIECEIPVLLLYPPLSDSKSPKVYTFSDSTRI